MFLCRVTVFRSGCDGVCWVQAGERNISSKVVKARAVPHVLHVPLDASNVRTPSHERETHTCSCMSLPQ